MEKLKIDPKKQQPILHEEHKEGMYDLVDEHISDAIFRCTFDGKINYANKAFLAAFGYSSSMQIGHLERVPSYVDKKILKIITTRLFSPKAKYIGEVEFIKRDGQKFYGQLSTIRFQNSVGDIYFDGVIRDISLERHYGKALQQNVKIQKKLLEISSKFINADPINAGHVIVQSLQDLGRFIKADRVQIHEYNFLQKICLHSYAWHNKGIPVGTNKEIDLSSISDIVKLHMQGKSLIANDVSKLPEGFLKRTAIDQKLKSVLLVPMFLNKDLIGFVSLEYLRKKNELQSENLLDAIRLFANMVANLANRSKDHVRLQRLVEKTALQNKRLTDFSFVISHHIRAATANITSLTNFLTTDLAQNEYLEMIESAVEKLNKGVNNINQILHVDQQHVLTKQTAKILSSIDKALLTLAKDIQINEIIIVNKVPDDLHAIGLIGHLDNIFYQIISNAIRYGTDQYNKKIELTAFSDANFIVIEVTDFGAGLDMERHSKELFKAGARFHGLICDGMGMGLFISKLQVESLGGSLTFISHLNDGAKVTVRLPKG